MPDPQASKSATRSKNFTRLPSILPHLKKQEEYISPFKPKFKPAILNTMPMNKTFDGIVVDQGKEIFYTPYQDKTTSFTENRFS